MDRDRKDKALSLAIMAVVVLLYFAFRSSLLYRDMFLDRFAHMAVNISLLLQLLVLVTAVGMFFINAYGYTIFKESRNLLISLAIFLYIITVVIGLVVTVNEHIYITDLDKQSAREMILLLNITILSILLIKLFVIRQDYFPKLPLRMLPLLFGGVLVVVLVVYSRFYLGSGFSEHLGLILLYLLIFATVIGYGYKYLIDGDLITKNILFVVIIHALSLSATADLQDFYCNTVSLTFRVISLFLLLNVFYRQLFTSYLQEVEELNRQREIYTQSLKEVVEEKTQDLLEYNRILEGEIDSAKRLQQSLLPPGEVVFSGASFVSRNIPCERLSGDFYDIYAIDKNKVGMYILDVSGHGINAALMNIYSYQYIRSTSPLVKRFLGDKPHKNLAYLYEEFNKMNFPDEMHIVMLIASYDMSIGTLTYSSGGLNTRPLLVRSNGEIRYLNTESGFPITKLGDFYTPRYKSVHVQLFKGDRILFYTDGLLDERQGIDLRVEDLELILLSTLNQPLSAVDQAICAHISSRKESLIDDISYFLMQVT